MNKYFGNVVIDSIASAKPWEQRSLSDVKSIIIHRNTIGEDPFDIAQYYVDKGWPGHPYAFQILQVGASIIVHQTAELCDVTYGVAGYNKKSIHIAIIGDFRTEEPTNTMFDGAAAFVADLLSYLSSRLKRRISIMSHSERTMWAPKKWQSKKKCPGNKWPMENFRRAVRQVQSGNTASMLVHPRSEPWWRV